MQFKVVRLHSEYEIVSPILGIERLSVRTTVCMSDTSHTTSCTGITYTSILSHAVA
jgi:hypothetical protein